MGICRPRLTTTTRHYGERDGLLGEYAWFKRIPATSYTRSEAGNRTQGLFDVYGSMVEWCQESIAFYRKSMTRDVEDPSPATGHNERIIRSGAYNFEPARLISGYLGPIYPRDPVGQLASASRVRSRPLIDIGHARTFVAL